MDDIGSIQKIYRQYALRLYNEANGVLNSPELAYDALHQAFASVFSRPVNSRDLDGPLMERVQSAALELAEMQEQPDGGGVAVKGKAISRKGSTPKRTESKLEALSSLTDSEQWAFILCDAKGLGIEQAAAHMETSTACVKQELLGARRVLRQRLGPETGIMLGAMLRLDPAILSEPEPKQSFSSLIAKRLPWAAPLVEAASARMAAARGKVAPLAAGSTTAIVLVAAVITTPSGSDVDEGTKSEAKQSAPGLTSPPSNQEEEGEQLDFGDGGSEQGSGGLTDEGGAGGTPAPGGAVPPAGLGGVPGYPPAGVPGDDYSDGGWVDNGGGSGSDGSTDSGAESSGGKTMGLKAGFAYVANSGSDNVSVVSLESNDVIETLEVGSSPRDVDAAPDDSRVYVANNGSNSVSVIDTSRNKVVAKVHVGREPRDVEVSPDGDYAYVANQGSDSVSVIRTSRNRVVDTVGGIANPRGIAVSPDGKRAYVSNPRSNTVSVIDLGKRERAGTIAVGQGPGNLAMSRDGGRLYVANYLSGSLTIVNSNKDTAVKSVKVGDNPGPMVLSANGKLLYVVNLGSGRVTVVGTGSETVKDRVKRSGSDADLADNGLIYLADSSRDAVKAVDPESGKVEATIDVGKAPLSLAIVTLDSASGGVSSHGS